MFSVLLSLPIIRESIYLLALAWGFVFSRSGDLDQLGLNDCSSNQRPPQLYESGRRLQRVSKIFSSLDNCLVRAVAWARLARWAGWPYCIHFSARKDAEGRLCAHTWVTDGAGRCVIGTDLHQLGKEFK